MSNNYKNFVFTGGNNCRIEHTKSLYNTTPGGRFRNTPYKTITEIVTPEFYTNFVRSVTFFNNFGGGTCRAYWAYKPIYDGDYIRIPVKTLYSFTVYSYPRKTHKIVTIKNM